MVVLFGFYSYLGTYQSSGVPSDCLLYCDPLCGVKATEYTIIVDVTWACR